MNVGKDMENAACPVDGNVIFAVIGKLYGDSSKLKNGTTISSRNFTPGYLSKENTKTLITIHTCTPIFFATLFTINKMWKQPKCLWKDE